MQKRSRGSVTPYLLLQIYIGLDDGVDGSAPESQKRILELREREYRD